MAFFSLSRLFSRDKSESAGCRFRTADQSKSERVVPANHGSPRQDDFVKIPFGGKVGLSSPDQERAVAVSIGLKPVRLPNDPRLPKTCFMTRDGDRDATAEEVEFHLELEREGLERHGLTFAEPGDPHGFLVKWKHKGQKTEA